MGFRVAAKCRYCGTKVDVFGDLCDDCFIDNDCTDNGVIALINADLAAINARLDVTAVGEGADA